MAATASVAWLGEAAGALDARATAIDVFVRDDDAGWEHDRLMAMLDVFDRHDAPIDLAVIPDAITDRVASDLRARHDSGLTHVHQHGYRHVDHELGAKRKCEFGQARSPEQIAVDVADGWQRLSALLGGCADPIFTPPWNRCRGELATVLAAQRFEVLSRDRSAGTIDHPGLAEVPVTLDWFAGRDKGGWNWSVLGGSLAGQLAGGETVGIMLHHGVTDTAELDRIDALLALLAGHPAVRLGSIRDLARRPAHVQGRSVTSSALPGAILNSVS